MWYASLSRTPHSLADIGCRFSSVFCVAELSTLPLSVPMDPRAVACTPSGMLIVSNEADGRLYEVHPTTGRCEHMQTAPKSPGLAYPISLSLVASECCLYVCDKSRNAIFRVALPPRMFVPPARALVSSSQ